MLKKIFTNPYTYVLLVAYYGVWLGWDALRLPFRNPDGIVSYLPSLEYNPTNNLMRFVFAILLPPLACLALWLLLNKRSVRAYFARPGSQRLLSALIVAVSVFLCVGMGIVQNSTTPTTNPLTTFGGPANYAQLDTFHEGETLGPAISYQDPSLKPYRDYVIVHGVFQDPLRSVIAFKLFGRSIGAARTFQVILGIAAFISYFILLLVLFRRNVFKAAFALAFLAILMLPFSTIPLIGTHIYGVHFPFRDIATVLFLIAAIIGLRIAGTGRRTAALGFTAGIIGFFAVAGFANSIDRAIYVAALSVLWLILVAFQVDRKHYAMNVLLPYIVGLLAGIPVLGLALKWAFKDFAEFLLTIIKQKEFLDGMVFAQPNWAVSIILIITAAVITVFGSFVIKAAGSKHIRGKDIRSTIGNIIALLRPLVREYGIYILLFATAAAFLRSAVGRAVPDHFIYSISWLYLFLVYAGIQYVTRIGRVRPEILGFFAVLLLGILTVFYTAQVKRIDIGKDTFPIHVSDDKFMRTDQAETVRFLKQNLKGDERFVTFTSEAAWYYFVDQPSPIKYPVIWYAFTPKERQTIAHELDSEKNIKYVVLNNNWTTDFDWVPNESRFPEAYQVLANEFEPYKGFGQQTIWIRK